MLHSTTYLVATHPDNQVTTVTTTIIATITTTSVTIIITTTHTDNQAWFFNNVEDCSTAMNDAIDVLDQVYQQYN